MADQELVKFRCLSSKTDIYVPASKVPQVKTANNRTMYVMDRKNLKCAKTGAQVPTTNKQGQELKPLYSSVPKSKIKK